jgi:hypothetical protein
MTGRWRYTGNRGVTHSSTKVATIRDYVDAILSELNRIFKRLGTIADQNDEIITLLKEGNKIMSGKSGPRIPHTDEALERVFGIRPGANMSVDPEPNPATLSCSICNSEHPNHATTIGD